MHANQGRCSGHTTAAAGRLLAAVSASFWPYTVLQVKGNGSFLMYANQKPSRVTVGDDPAEVEWDAATGAAAVMMEGGDKLTRQLTVFF